jgi:hypothetical protein
MGGVIEGDFRPIADRKALKRWGIHIVGKSGSLARRLIP